MLKRLSIAVAVLCLTALAFSFITEGKMDACCEAANFTCVKTANQRIALGRDRWNAAAQELDCLNDKLLRKESEWRVLTAQPGLHAWRIRMTRDEMIFLKGVISSRQAKLKDAN